MVCDCDHINTAEHQADLRIKDDATIDDGEGSSEDSDGDVESEEDSGNSEEEVIEYATDEDPEDEEEEEDEEEDVEDLFPISDRKKDEEAGESRRKDLTSEETSEEDIQQNQAFYQRYHKDGSTYFPDDSSSDEVSLSPPQLLTSSTLR